MGWDSLDHFVELKEERMKKFLILYTGDTWEGEKKKKVKTHILFPFSQKKLQRSSEERKMGVEGGRDKWVEENRSCDFRYGNQLIWSSVFILGRKMLVLTEECNKFVRK